jgi:hypothetical protein
VPDVVHKNIDHYSELIPLYSFLPHGAYWVEVEASKCLSGQIATKAMFVNPILTKVRQRTLGAWCTNIEGYDINVFQKLSHPGKLCCESTYSI